MCRCEVPQSAVTATRSYGPSDAAKVPPMRRLTVLLLVLLVVVAAGAAAAYTFILQPGAITDGPAASTSEAIEQAPASAVEVRDAFLATPQQVDLSLAVDLPKGAGADNPDHQEITASGQIDYSAGNADLVYDFGELTNAGGHLGDFDTLHVLYVDSTAYLKIFVSGPPWLTFDPEDATSPYVLRLREVMLTAPMILPGLLEVAGGSEASKGGLPLQIDVEALADADDELAAGLGSALEELRAADVTLDVGADSSVALAFSYPGTEGRTDVQVSYEMSPFNEQVSVEAPKPSRVRTFSSIFG